MGSISPWTQNVLKNKNIKNNSEAEIKRLSLAKFVSDDDVVMCSPRPTPFPLPSQPRTFWAFVRAWDGGG